MYMTACRHDRNSVLHDRVGVYSTTRDTTVNVLSAVSPMEGP